MTTTYFGKKTRSLRIKQTERKPDSFARVLLNYVLLLSTVYSSYAGNFFLGEFPQYVIVISLVYTSTLTLEGTYPRG